MKTVLIETFDNTEDLENRCNALDKQVVTSSHNLPPHFAHYELTHLTQDKGDYTAVFTKRF